MPRPVQRTYNLDRLFGRLEQKESDHHRYEILRAAAKVLAEEILENTPPGPDQDDAIRHVRKALHMAQDAIAFEESLLKTERLVSHLSLHLKHKASEGVEAVSVNPEDAASLLGHYDFRREADATLVAKGVVGYLGGVPVCADACVESGYVRLTGPKDDGLYLLAENTGLAATG